MTDRTVWLNCSIEELRTRITVNQERLSRLYAKLDSLVCTEHEHKTVGQVLREDNRWCPVAAIAIEALFLQNGETGTLWERFNVFAQQNAGAEEDLMNAFVQDTISKCPLVLPSQKICNVFRRLQAAGIRVLIVTDGKAMLASKLLSQLGCLPDDVSVVGIDTVLQHADIDDSDMSPDVLAFVRRSGMNTHIMHALGKLGVPEENAMVFLADDNPRDIDALDMFRSCYTFAVFHQHVHFADSDARRGVPLNVNLLDALLRFMQEHEVLRQ